MYLEARTAAAPLGGEALAVAQRVNSVSGDNDRKPGVAGIKLNLSDLLGLQAADSLRVEQRMPGRVVDVSQGDRHYRFASKPSLRPLSLLAFNQEVSV